MENEFILDEIKAPGAGHPYWRTPVLLDAEELIRDRLDGKGGELPVLTKERWHALGFAGTAPRDELGNAFGVVLVTSEIILLSGMTNKALGKDYNALWIVNRV